MGKILITGASSEIGRAIVERVDSMGLPMVLQYAHNSSALKRWNDRHTTVKCDFTNEEQLNEFINQLEDIEVLIYAAGRTDSALVPELSDTSIYDTVAVNIVAFTKICRAIIAPMAVARRGVIIGISSVTAERVYRGQTLYAGSKAYMEAFIKGVAAEWGKKGIRANCVAPGSIDAGALKRLSHVKKEELKAVNASNRMGTPQDVAEAVYFLLSNSASFINGSILSLDGGHWMGV